MADPPILYIIKVHLFPIYNVIFKQFYVYNNFILIVCYNLNYSSHRIKEGSIYSIVFMDIKPIKINK